MPHQQHRTGSSPPDRLHLLAEHGVRLDRALERSTVLGATLGAVLELVEADAGAVVEVQRGVARILAQRGLSPRSAEAWWCPVDLQAADGGRAGATSEKGQTAVPSRRKRRRILPEADLGISSMNSTLRICL